MEAERRERRKVRKCHLWCQRRNLPSSRLVTGAGAQPQHQQQEKKTQTAQMIEFTDIDWRDVKFMVHDSPDHTLRELPFMERWHKIQQEIGDHKNVKLVSAHVCTGGAPEMIGFLQQVIEKGGKGSRCSGDDRLGRRGKWHVTLRAAKIYSSSPSCSLHYHTITVVIVAVHFIVVGAIFWCGSSRGSCKFAFLDVANRGRSRRRRRGDNCTRRCQCSGSKRTNEIWSWYSNYRSKGLGSPIPVPWDTDQSQMGGPTCCYTLLIFFPSFFRRIRRDVVVEGEVQGRYVHRNFHWSARVAVVEHVVGDNSILREQLA